MTWAEIESNWKAVSDVIKVTWGKLSEDDLTAVAGGRDQLAEMLQQQYGYKKVVAEAKVDRFALELNLEPGNSKAIYRLNQSRNPKSNV